IKIEPEACQSDGDERETADNGKSDRPPDPGFGPTQIARNGFKMLPKLANDIRHIPACIPQSTRCSSGASQPSVVNHPLKALLRHSINLFVSNGFVSRHTAPAFDARVCVSGSFLAVTMIIGTDWSLVASFSLRSIPLIPVR